MTKNFQGQDTRNLSKDKFEDSRKKNISNFLQKLNKDNNDYFNNPPNNYIVNTKKKVDKNYEYFSSIQNNVENSFISDKNSEIFNIDKSLAKFSPIDNKNFNKIIDNNYNRFENFSLPQSTTEFIPGDVKLKENKNKNMDPKIIISNNSECSKEIHKEVMKDSYLLKDMNGNYIPNTPPIIDRTQSYMAEIGDKRRLSNIIYNSLLKTYHSISKDHISEFQIHELLEKVNLNNYKDKDKIKTFVSDLKLMVSENANNSLNKNNTGIMSDDCLFEKETKNNTFYLFIDTKDRDTKKWPTIEEFGFFFGGQNVLSWNKKNIDKDPKQEFSDQKYPEYIDSQLGYIERDFNNVTSVELTEIIIPRKTENGDNYQVYPYLLLDIEEFGNVYEGTNQFSSTAFGKVSFDKIIGNYAYYNSPENNHLIKKFNPRISLNKITVKIRKPNGELFRFGKYILNPETDTPILIKDPIFLGPQIEINNNLENLINEDKIDIPQQKENKLEANLSITFKIICIQRSLETMFLNKKGN